MTWMAGSPVRNRPRPAHRDGNLDREPDRLAGDGPHRGELLHGGVHSEAARGRSQAVVPIEPAGDRVATEADDAAAVAVQFGDQRIVNGIEVARQFFGASQRSELLGQRLGQRGEA